MKFKIILLALVLLFSFCGMNAQNNWDKVFPNDFLGFSVGMKVKPTADGGYIAAGEIDLATGAVRHYIRLIKTDAAGNLEWEHVFDSLDVTIGQVYFLDVLPNNEFIVGGMEDGMPLLMKMSTGGDVIWKKTYPTNNYGFVKSGTTSLDGGFLLVGYAQEDFGIATTILLIKMDDDGNLEWEKEINYQDYAIANSVEVTMDGGYILAVERDNHIMLLKMDSEGNVLWERLYQFSSLDYAQAIKPTPDGGFIVGGSMQGINSSVPFVFKTDSLGNGEWSKTLLGDAAILVTDLVLTTDGGYAVVGSVNGFFLANPEGFFLKLDALGNTEWSENYANEEQKITALSTTPDGGYILTGYTVDGLLLKKIGGTTSVSSEKKQNSLYQVFPNPMKEQTLFEIKTIQLQEIQLQLFDGTGRLVREEKHGAGSFIFHKKDLSHGMYFYKIKNGNGMPVPSSSGLQNGKLIIAD